LNGEDLNPSVPHGLLARATFFNECRNIEIGEEFLEYDDGVGAYVPLIIDAPDVSFIRRSVFFDELQEQSILDRLNFIVQGNVPNFRGRGNSFLEQLDAVGDGMLEDYTDSLICTYHLGISIIPFEHVMLYEKDGLLERFFYFRAFASAEMLDQYFANFRKMCNKQGDPGPRPIGPIMVPLSDQQRYLVNPEQCLRGHAEFEWVGQRFLYHCQGLFKSSLDGYRLAPSAEEREFGKFTGVAGAKVRYFCWQLSMRKQQELWVLLGPATKVRRSDDARGPISSLFQRLPHEIVALILGVTLRAQ